ncbi:MAG: hypothetical protein MI802_02805, partial [Desulfobacterales bacterium]|nr:hypothetical protein [Desulfobacterales bacterium]
MKKLAVALFVALLGLAFTAPAFALENKFGGYYRIRMFNNTDFSGVDGGGQDVQQADTRTRLYYTAIINDNLKFVNKFEMDAVWGGEEDTDVDNDGSATADDVTTQSYGDIGADGVSVEVKNTYLDFTYGPANVKMGTHGGTIQRGFIFADDFSGITFSTGAFTGLYAKVEENGDSTSDDSQMYHANYAFKMGDTTVTPNLTYYDINDLDNDASAETDDSLIYFGLDVDGAAAGFDYWATFIYNSGELEDNDVGGYLFAFGGSMGLNDMTSIHGQFFTATGDESGNTGDLDAFQTAPGNSYYWSE